MSLRKIVQPGFGAVVRFSGEMIDSAAIHVGEIGWYITGNPDAQSWAEVVRAANGAPIEVLVEPVDVAGENRVAQADSTPKPGSGWPFEAGWPFAVVFDQTTPSAPFVVLGYGMWGQVPVERARAATRVAAQTELVKATMDFVATMAPDREDSLPLGARVRAVDDATMVAFRRLDGWTVHGATVMTGYCWARMRMALGSDLEYAVHYNRGLVVDPVGAALKSNDEEIACWVRPGGETR